MRLNETASFFYAYIQLRKRENSRWFFPTDKANVQSPQEEV